MFTGCLFLVDYLKFSFVDRSHSQRSWPWELWVYNPPKPMVCWYVYGLDNCPQATLNDFPPKDTYNNTLKYCEFLGQPVFDFFTHLPLAKTCGASCIFQQYSHLPRISNSKTKPVPKNDLTLSGPFRYSVPKMNLCLSLFAAYACHPNGQPARIEKALVGGGCIGLLLPLWSLLCNDQDLEMRPTSGCFFT